MMASAADLAVADVRFLQYENGPSQLADHQFTAGDSVWFDCRIQGFGRSEDEDPKFALNWTWRVIDASGRDLVRGGAGKVNGELAREDKDYRPRIRFDFQLPPLLLRGVYAVELTVKDEIAKSEKKLRQPFSVGGRVLDPAPELTATQFRFFRREEDRRPLDAVRYRPGDTVWLRFDIAGFRHGANNRIGVAYGMLVLGPSGQPFLREENGARFETESFYPQFYVPAAVQVKLPAQAASGEYIVLLTLQDYIGKLSAAVRTSFTVE
jgi:hypothetical protein